LRQPPLMRAEGPLGAAIISMPNGRIARPNWVRRPLSTAPPATGVCQ
jgi:hypothetical protein